MLQLGPNTGKKQSVQLTTECMVCPQQTVTADRTDDLTSYRHNYL